MAGGGQVCKFYLEGRCKFGAQCKFRHPGGGGGGGGNWNSGRGGGGGGGRHQGDPVDSGRRWDQKGGNRFQLFSDGGGGGSGSYSHGRGWDDRGQNQWRGGGRGGGGGGGWRGGRGGGMRSGNYGQSPNQWYQSDRYQNQQHQNDRFHYQSDRYSNDHHRQQKNWSTRGQSLFSDNQGSSNYQNSYSSSRYYQREGRYGYDDHQQTSQLSDPQEIVAQIRLDMEEWKSSCMWPLSCYAYSRETPCLPGFTDVSPEELRWEAYQAKSSGSSQQYLKTVGQLNEARLKTLHEFSNITRDDVKDILSNLKSSSDASSQKSLFSPTTSGPTVSSLFGSTTPTNSLFGSQKQSSLFQSSPPPTAPAPPSLFSDASSLTKQMSTTIGQQQSDQTQATPHVQSQTQSSTVSSGAPDHDSSAQLTKEEMDAFKADKFILGQIPEHAPPDYLCN